MLLLYVFTLFLNSGEAVNCHMDRDRGYPCDVPQRTLFYYSTQMGICQPMLYRGCGGNENKFTTAEECKEICTGQKARNESMLSTEEKEKKELVVDECNIPTDAKIPDVVIRCDDGCPKNYHCNRKNKCCPTKDYICSLPTNSGSEVIKFKHYRRYAYLPAIKNCIGFSYFGSGGSFNNFPTYNDCKRYCMGSKKFKKVDN